MSFFSLHKKLKSTNKRVKPWGFENLSIWIGSVGLHLDLFMILIPWKKPSFHQNNLVSFLMPALCAHAAVLIRYS